MNERVARAYLIARVHLAHEPDFSLGKIEVRPARREIAGEGCRDTIDPRVMRVLVALARARGEILSRDDLIESCWDGVIVGEDAITRCISRLRAAAEASGNEFSIETVPRVGYRLITPDSAAVGVQDVGKSKQPPVQTAPISWFMRNRGAAVAGAISPVLFALGAGLWWFWPGPAYQAQTANLQAAPANSVAVLPFANMSGDSSKEYFSDGFSQELINDLSYDPHLRVVARTSAFAFKGKNEDIETIARALHVRTVVEGSIREVGNRVRITAQLVSANDGYRIWSASYDRNLTDILSVQDEIAHAITASLTRELLHAPQIKTGRPTTISAEAYRAYLQGQSHMTFIDADEARKAIPFFQKATALQPDFAQAHSWLAGAYITASLGRFAGQDRSALFSAARVAAERALELAPDNLDALGIHLNLSVRDGDWAGAVADADRMQKINPNGSLLLFWMAPYYSFLGFPDRALKSAQAAVALDPLSFPRRLAVVWDLQLIGRYKEAAAAGEEALPLHHDPGLERDLCTAYAMTGRLDDARRIVAEFDAKRDSLDSDGCRVDIAKGGRRLDEARAIMDRVAANYGRNDWSASDVADCYAIAGDYPKAILWMNRAYDLNETEVFTIHLDKEISPEFQEQPGWLAFWDKPRARAWKAAHDMVAAELATREGSP